MLTEQYLVLDDLWVLLIGAGGVCVTQMGTFAVGICALSPINVDGAGDKRDIDTFISDKLEHTPFLRCGFLANVYPRSSARSLAEYLDLRLLQKPSLQ